MTDSGTLIQSQSARFRAREGGREQGIVMLYPDKLAAVGTSAALWGHFLGPLVLTAISFPRVHDIGAFGAAIGVLVGGWIGEGIGKRTAARKVAADRDGVMVVPLDSITSVETR